MMSSCSRDNVSVVNIKIKICLSLSSLHLLLLSKDEAGGSGNNWWDKWSELAAATLCINLAWLQHHDSTDDESHSEDDDVLQILLDWAAATGASWLGWGWGSGVLGWGWSSSALGWGSRHSRI